MEQEWYEELVQSRDPPRWTAAAFEEFRRRRQSVESSVSSNSAGGPAAVEVADVSMQENDNSNDDGQDDFEQEHELTVPGLSVLQELSQQQQQRQSDAQSRNQPASTAISNRNMPKMSTLHPELPFKLVYCDGTPLTSLSLTCDYLYLIYIYLHT